MQVFTETEKSQWKSLLWCLGLNPLFERGCGRKISLALQSFVSLMGLNESTAREMCWSPANNTQPLAGSLFQK